MHSTAHPIAPLTRMVRARRRRIPRRIWAAFATVIALKLLAGAPSTADCRTASRNLPARLAAAVCEREFLASAAPETGARLADAERRAGHTAVAGALANGLLVTSARADALWVIGMIAVAEHQLDTARRAFEGARTLHLAEQRTAAAARDDLALAALGLTSPIESLAGI